MNKRQVTDLVFFGSIAAMVAVAGLYLYLIKTGSL